MRFLFTKNVERKYFSMLYFFFFYFLLHNDVKCSSKRVLYKSSNLFNIYSVVSDDVKLKHKNEYTKRMNQGIKEYEQINKKTKVYFLPLIFKTNSEEKAEKKTYEQTFSENSEETKESKNINSLNKHNKNDFSLIKESAFEYLENNLSYVKDRMETFIKHINECDFILIPLNYYDILNKHLLGINTFINFINAIDTLFYVENKKNDYNFIFFIYNYYDGCNGNDKFIKKEKNEIMHIIKTFLKKHLGEKYDTHIQVKFLFDKENLLDIKKINTDVNNKKYYYNKKIKKITTKKIIHYNKDENNTFFQKYKPDFFKVISDQNYFLYNLYSNLKLDIIQEYLSITKDMRSDNLHTQKNKVKEIINDVETLLNRFLSFRINTNVKIENQQNLEKIKNKQYFHLLYIILSDLLEKYDYNLDKIKSNLYQLFKENIKKIKITSNLIHEFKKEINYMDKLFDLYNSKISFASYFKNKHNYFEQRSYYVYYYNKMRFLQLLNETTNEIINYYISKGLYVQNYDFNSLILLKNYSFFNYIIYYFTSLLKNKINFTFNYLSPNAFGFSSYKDDISISPKKSVMVTTSEIDQLEKIKIPRSEYSKILLLFDKNKR